MKQLPDGKFKRKAEHGFRSIEEVYKKENMLYINGQLFNTKDIIIPNPTKHP